MKELWLSNNFIHSIPSEIAQLRNLEILGISGCGLEKLAPEVCILEKLQMLVAQRNKLTELPDLFWKLKSLKTLIIASNEFTVFPEVICQCVTLTAINISKNPINVLPDSFADLRSLIFLDAIGCNLTEFPVFMKKMPLLFCAGIGDITKIPDKSATQKPKKLKKKVSVDRIAVQSVPKPLIPISVKEEEELLSFIRHRAAARAKKASSTRAGTSTPAVV